jgi:hypothetical protein
MLETESRSQRLQELGIAKIQKEFRDDQMEVTRPTPRYKINLSQGLWMAVLA